MGISFFFVRLSAFLGCGRDAGHQPWRSQPFQLVVGASDDLFQGEHVLVTVHHALQALYLVTGGVTLVQ